MIRIIQAIKQSKAMHIIDIKLIEEALQQAKDKLRNNENRPMSEAAIEAKACIDCFEYVLKNCLKLKCLLK